MPSLDIVTSQSPFRNHLCVPVAHPLYPGGTQNKNIVKLRNTNRFELPWNEQFQFPKMIQRKARVIMDGNRTFVSAVATMEPDVLVQTDEIHEQKHALESKFGQLSVTSEESTSELDEPERLRRMRISKANKGKVPWNMGRKHSHETLQLIRERTRIAMQDPKVKMKLIYKGRCQSEETKLRIKIGQREGWRKRKERLTLQEACYLEWQNAIAEISRVGYGGEEELQWDSYLIFEEQLKKEWAERVEVRESMPRPQGNKRAPKSLEQRRKISEAISAKWADPDYRERVSAAIKHRAGVQVERESEEKPSMDAQKSRKKLSGNAQTSAKNSRRRKSKELCKLETVQKTILKKKGPTYKDPMARSKLETIKQIRVQRMEMENNRKWEATERANEETKLRIKIGQRESWRKRKERLTLQEACNLEWQNAIAEISRVGYGGEEELQWDSYLILEEQLKKEWAERVEMREGNKRAPKSLEQRRKISEAISAKWADPVYWERVYTAINYRAGVQVERESEEKPSMDAQKSRKKLSGKAQTSAKNTKRRKSKELCKLETVQKTILKKKGPTYKDPMARSKLETIKQIRVQRMEMENNRKWEATERANEETKLKMKIGQREGWRKRTEKLTLQEACYLEWKNAIEISRVGYGGEEELQWDSYQILEERWKKEWAERVEMRESMRRPKGNKREPKSPQHHRKISSHICKMD